MRKHFNRVKQIADQTFARAERSELLTDDLVEVETRIEFIKQTCATTAKKLATTILALRKGPEYQLGVTLNEMLHSTSSRELEDDLLRNVVATCTRLELSLAQVSQQLEADIEADVVQRLTLVVDKDLSNVAKLKTQLKKCILDMDSARSRYQAACKNSSANGHTKADSIKEELEEAETKVEQCRDTLATEMYNMVSRESEIAQVIVDYVHMQKRQHEEALSHLNDSLPRLTELILANPMKPMFGQSLEEHLKLNACEIAFPIELCTRALCQIGMGEEGLFRVTGGASKVKRLKTCLDAHCIKFEEAPEYDAHVLAGVLKLYLRELPEPLLTYALYERWLEAARVEPSDLRLQALWSVLAQLPPSHHANLRYLIKFLAKLCDNQAVNKMTSQNIAIVIGPNILWSNEERLLSDNIGINMNTASAYSVIVDSLVSHSEYFFPGPEEFYVTPPTSNTRAKSDDTVDTGRTTALLNGHHSRASSADAGLIITDSNILRSHSTDSIQESQSGNSSGGGGGSGPSSDSPRPITRRKNKPAPVPPVQKSTPESKPSSDFKSTPDGSGDKSSPVAGPGFKSNLVPGKAKDTHSEQSEKSGDKSSHQGSSEKSSTGSGGGKFSESRWKTSDGPAGKSSLPMTKSNGKSSEPSSPRVKIGGTVSGETHPSTGSSSKVTASSETHTPASEKCGGHIAQVTNSTKNSSDKQTGLTGSSDKLTGASDRLSNTSDKLASDNKVTNAAESSRGVASERFLASERGVSAAAEGNSTAGVEVKTASGRGMSRSVDVGHGKNPFDEDEEDSSTPAVPAASTRHHVESIYATYDRKAPRPTPAPRCVSVYGEDLSAALRKPAVPERPATLGRPLSSSFRIVRPAAGSMDELKTTGFAKPADPPKPKPAADCDTPHPHPQAKPDKPPKPCELTLPSHARSLSDGNTIDLAGEFPSGKSSDRAASPGGPPPSPSLLTRASLPAPPLPPTAPRQHSSGSYSESTDL